MVSSTYSCTIIIICLYTNGFKYSYLMQLICTQVYGFIYRVKTLLWSLQRHCYWYNDALQKHESNASPTL